MIDTIIKQVAQQGNVNIVIIGVTEDYYGIQVVGSANIQGIKFLAFYNLAHESDKPMVRIQKDEEKMGLLDTLPEDVHEIFITQFDKSIRRQQKILQNISVRLLDTKEELTEKMTAISKTTIASIMTVSDRANFMAGKLGIGRMKMYYAKMFYIINESVE
jgi:hypothetical protein